MLAEMVGIVWKLDVQRKAKRTRAEDRLVTGSAHDGSRDFLQVRRYALQSQNEARPQQLGDELPDSGLALARSSENHDAIWQRSLGLRRGERLGWRKTIV